MVDANRSWRLVAGMSKVMMAAFATGAVSPAYPTIWQLSATMGPWRLSAATIVASAAMIAWLSVDHKLWKRPRSAGARDRAVLYNASTVITLTIGHPVGFSTLLTMAWLVAAVATLGGALGSGMEVTTRSRRPHTGLGNASDSTTRTDARPRR
jgi:hypothetical protein